MEVYFGVDCFCGGALSTAWRSTIQTFLPMRVRLYVCFGPGIRLCVLFFAGRPRSPNLALAFYMFEKHTPRQRPDTSGCGVSNRRVHIRCTFMRAWNWMIVKIGAPRSMYATPLYVIGRLCFITYDSGIHSLFQFSNTGSVTAKAGASLERLLLLQ